MFYARYARRKYVSSRCRTKINNSRSSSMSVERKAESDSIDMVRAMRFNQCDIERMSQIASRPSRRERRKMFHTTCYYLAALNIPDNET